MKGFSFCGVPSRSFWLSLATLMGLLVGIAAPGRADLRMFPGYNSAVAIASDAPPCAFCSASESVDGNPGGGAAAQGASSGALAFPGQNESRLKAVSNQVSSGSPYNAGSAFGQLNVHYTVMNSSTGKIDTSAQVDMTIKATASLASDSDSSTLNQAGWDVSVGLDVPPPVLNLEFDNSGDLVSAFFLNAFPPLQDGGAHGVINISGGQAIGSSASQDIFGTNSSQSATLADTLVIFTGGTFDVDAIAAVSGIGYAVLDPVLVPVNPNDVLVSSAPINPDPNAPLFTASEAASLTAEGVDVSGLDSLGLIGQANVPEPRALPLVAVGLSLIGSLLILRKRRSRALP